MQITVDQITYENVYPDGKCIYNDVICNNEVIGSLIFRRQGCLEPMIEKHQMGIDDNKITKEMRNITCGICDTEDEGYSFIQTDSVENFVKIYNLSVV